ncbi:amino acid ABC transporter permease [Pseudonocardia asaccharolytica]|uniref:Amino acid ABC transporter permease n=1 Tax=Pseudonocardia asaccharolytica DSM 44247 = NBRC 16224 TaxID=1123024 RepID=A0A511D3A0_9PSEU|nr:amino acid ABC transporter permease [Pseudonocardia asaccharolytica]GEL18993.1 amino acid ABC transporter permease [Pseudonocardia asaccharolytica DSM 44247 = NBRC 16224]
MGVILEQFPLYVQGFLQTLRICVFAAIGSLVLGTLLAGFRVSPLAPLRAVGSGWVTVFRNTPLAVVLFAVAFGLPEVGVNGSYFWFGVTGLTMYTSAFVCEAVRSGINSVAPGQAEAARAVGLTFSQTLSLVVLPQALRTVVPPLGSVIIAMIKNSAIVGAFGVGGDLYSVGLQLTSAQGYAAVGVLTGVLLGYLVLTIPAGIALAAIERRTALAR